MKIELPFVMAFLISLTHRCNLTCSMCTQYGEGFKEFAKDELSADEWDNFFQSIMNISPKPQIILMGGEPLLYREFSEIIQRLKKYDFNILLVTNGTLLKKYLPELDDLNLNITLSLDGNECTHDKIRNKKGVYASVIQSIEQIQAMNFPKLSVSVNTVILPENIDELYEFADNISKYKIDGITFQHMQFTTELIDKISQKEWSSRMGINFCSCFHPLKPFNVTDEYLKKVKKFMSDIVQKCSFPVAFFPCFEEDEAYCYYKEERLEKLRGGRICTEPWMSPSISPNGDVSNCINNVIGNIKDEDFWTIWSSEKADKLRQCLLKNGSFSVCKKCCNFYKGNFIYAPGCKIRLGKEEYDMENELNFIYSYRNVAFFEDNNVLYPHSFTSKREFDEYSANKKLMYLTNKI